MVAEHDRMWLSMARMWRNRADSHEADSPVAPPPPRSCFPSTFDILWSTIHCIKKFCLFLSALSHFAMEFHKLHVARASRWDTTVDFTALGTMLAGHDNDLRSKFSKTPLRCCSHTRELFFLIEEISLYRFATDSCNATLSPGVNRFNLQAVCDFLVCEKRKTKEGKGDGRASSGSKLDMSALPERLDGVPGVLWDRRRLVGPSVLADDDFGEKLRLFTFCNLAVNRRRIDIKGQNILNTHYCAL